jgi:aldehyde:ferredoxin oxidoreductase
MRVYNNREGLRIQDDRLPDRFHDEPIASGRKQGDVLNREKFREMLDLYYQMMGWDENGVPRPATLYDYQLEWTLAD